MEGCLKVKNEVKESNYIRYIHFVVRLITFAKRIISFAIHGESLPTAKLHEVDSTRYMLTISVKKVFLPHDCNISSESTSKLCFNTRRQKKTFFASSFSESTLL